MAVEFPFDEQIRNNFDMLNNGTAFNQGCVQEVAAMRQGFLELATAMEGLG